MQLFNSNTMNNSQLLAKSPSDIALDADRQNAEIQSNHVMTQQQGEGLASIQLPQISCDKLISSEESPTSPPGNKGSMGGKGQQEHQKMKVASFSKQYSLEENCILGDGANAVVKLCRKNGEPNLYAVKIFKDGDEEMINIIIRTFKVHKSLSHNFIIKAYELFINHRTAHHHLVQEYVDWPSLAKEISSREKSRFTEGETKLVI